MDTPITPNPVRANTSASSNLRWQYVVPTLFIMQAIYMIAKINVGIVMAFPPFQKVMGLVGKPAMASLLMTLFLVAYGAAMPFWGMVSDRWGPRVTAIAGTLVGMAAMVLSAAAPNLTVLYVARIALGLGLAVVWPVANHMSARWFPVVERSQVSGLWIGGINFGIVVAGLTIPELLASAGWRAVFALSAAFGLILLALFLFVTRDEPRQVSKISDAEIALIEGGNLKHTDVVPEHDVSGGRSALANYRFWLLTVSNIATGMGIFGLNTWLPTYLTKVRHLTLAGSGVYTSIAWFVGIFVCAFWGRWSDKVVRRAPFGLIGYLVYALALLGATMTTNVTVAMVLIGITILAVQSTTVIVFSLLHSLGSEHRMGSGAGWLSGLSNFVGAFAPLIMGAILQASGNWGASFGFLTGMALLSAVLMGIMIPQRY